MVLGIMAAVCMGLQTGFGSFLTLADEDSEYSTVRFWFFLALGRLVIL